MRTLKGEGDVSPPMLDGLKRRIREYRIRARLAWHALKGSDFVRETHPGHLLTRRSHETELPEWTNEPDSEARAAMFGRASEVEQRYVSIRDVRERYEDGDSDLFRLVGEMAQLQGYDGDLLRALRTVEHEYRDDAEMEIRRRLEVDKRTWDESGMHDTYVITDPRLKYRMTVRVTARDNVRHDDRDRLPPHVDQAIQQFPMEVLSVMSDGEEQAHMMAN